MRHLPSRIARAQADFGDRCATRTERFETGVALFHDDLPVVWDLNYLRVDRPGLGAGELAERADGLQGWAGLKHRKIQVNDAELGASLCDGFTTLDYSITPLFVMVATRQPEVAPRMAAREATLEETLPYQREIMTRQPFVDETNDGEMHQLVAKDEVFHHAGNARHFVAEVDGQIVSACALYSLNGLGQIEDVGTFEEHRNRGLASAVVLAALEASRAQGHDETFLLADAEDWPARWYARLGFQELARHYEFLKTPEIGHGYDFGQNP